MSTFIIEYGYMNDVTGEAKQLSKKLNSRIDDYQGITKKANKISTTRNNISQANYYIDKKNKMMEDKCEKLDSFITKIEDFCDEVKEADGRVARRIADDTRTFMKVNNISISVVSVLGLALEELARSWFGKWGLDGASIVNKIKEKLRNAKYSIKDWYYDKGGKYIVNIVVDAAIVALEVAIVVATVATGGTVAAILAAAFAAYKAGATLFYDVQAGLTYAITDNRIIADKIDEKGGKEATQFLLKLRGYDENVAAFLYDAANLASIIYGGYKAIEGWSGVVTALQNHDASFLSTSKFYFHDKGMGKLASGLGGTGSFKYNAVNIYKWTKDIKKPIQPITATRDAFSSGGDILSDIVTGVKSMFSQPTRITPMPKYAGYSQFMPAAIAI